MVNEYNQLLPQYHANKKMVAELMYYKMLSSIPRESAAESFPLLDLSHDQFLAWVKNPQLLTNPSSNVANRDDIRQVNRDVNRGRSGRVF